MDVITARTGGSLDYTFYLKQKDVNGMEGTFDLSNATSIGIYLQRYGESTLTVSSTMTIVSATEGKARYLFDLSGFSEGDYLGEIIAYTSTEKVPSQFFLLRLEKSLPR